MWDRWRSGMGGGGGPDQHHLGAKTRASTFSPSAPASTMNSTAPQGNYNNSWQPRSSVIAARQQGQPNLDNSRLAGKAGPPPPRPPRDYETVPAPPAREPYQSRALQHRSQTLPPSAPPLAQNNGYRDSVGRPPSSVYSQAPTVYTDLGKAHNASRYTTSPGEVSPPSSPEFSAADPVPNHDISPIDEESDFLAHSSYSHQQSQPPPAPKAAPKSSDHASLPSRQRAASRQAGDLPEVPEAPSPKSPAASTARSNIPMMRRERRQQKEAQAAANRLRSLSGREEGRVPPPAARGLGISTVVASPPESPEQQRQPPRAGSRAGGGGGGGEGGGGPTRRQAQGPPTSYTDPAAKAFVSSRPGWKGASGRTAIVDPVKDNPEVEPLKIPPRSARRNSPRPAEGDAPPAVEQEQQQQQQQQQQQGYINGAGAGAAVNDLVAGAGVGEEGGVVDVAISGATISPETATLSVQQIGGGGGAGKDPLSNSTTTATTTAAPAPTTTTTGTTTTTTPPSTTNTNTPTNTNITTNNHNSSSSSSNNKTSLASTLRRIIPSSGQRQSRIFSGSALISSLGGQKHQLQPQATTAAAQQGYPSPPLSGTTSTATGFPFQQGASGTGTVSAGGSSTGAVNATATADAAQIDSYASTQWPTGAPHPQQPPHHPSSTFPLRSSSAGYPHDHQDAIRRKEIGSGPPSAAPTQQRHATGHQPHESFSSSVYSRPEDDHHLQHPSYPYQEQYRQSQAPPRQPPHPIHLNTKNLPSLPGEASSDSPYVQPPSRFSITTYATSGRESSPRDSFDTQAHIPPPLPTPPKDIVMGLTRKTSSSNKASQGLPGSGSDPLVQADSVLERRRPELRGGENRWSDALPDDTEPVKISLTKTWMSTAGANSAGINATSSPPRARKQTAKGPRDLQLSSQQLNPRSESNKKENSGGGRGFGFGFLSPRSPASGSDSNNSRPASILSNVDKDLPPAPSASAATAVTTTDRIAQLNAQLQDLANRRININRAIKQMTELMPKDNLIMPEEVRKKREDEKRKIEDLRTKLSDIQGEEHDLGMKLHRAYKKLDKQTEYEPTTLWVRRATGS